MFPSSRRQRAALVISGRSALRLLGMTMRMRRASALTLVSIAALALTACNSDGHESPSGWDAASAAPVEQYLGLPVEPLDNVADLDLPFLGLPFAGPDADRVWLGAPEGLAWLDLDDGEAHVVDRIPGVYVGLVGTDTLYRAGYQAQTIAKYDVSGDPREVARARVHWPLGVAADRAVLWVTDHTHSRLLRLDPETLKVTRRIQIGKSGPDDGDGAAGLAWVGDHLWVVSKWDASLYEVDGRSGDILRVVALGAADMANPLVLTSAGLWAWVGDRTTDGVAFHSLVLVDPVLGEVTARLRLREPADLEVDALAQVSAPVEVAGGMWVPVDHYLVHLDADRDWAPDKVLGLPEGTVVLTSAVAGDYLWYYTPSPAPHVARVPLADLAPAN